MGYVGQASFLSSAYPLSISSLPPLPLLFPSFLFSFLLLSFSKLWDVLSDEEALEVVKTKTDASTEAKLVARALLGTAIRGGSTDNVSVIFVRL